MYRSLGDWNWDLRPPRPRVGGALLVADSAGSFGVVLLRASSAVGVVAANAAAWAARHAHHLANRAGRAADAERRYGSYSAGVHFPETHPDYERGRLPRRDTYRRRRARARFRRRPVGCWQ